MSMYQIPPPAPMVLKGDVAENWRDFESVWKYYCIATGLNNVLTNAEGEPNPAGRLQVAATLCSVMGIECLKIMNSLPTLTEDDKKDAERIITELKAHFIPQRHVLFERYKFNTAVQKDEMVDEYIVCLRQLAASCEFDALSDSLIRDRLIIGTTNNVYRERLLRERPIPDLNRCIECLRASELSKTHRQHMEQNGLKSSDTINHVHGKKATKNKPQHKKPPTNKTSKNNACKWCGNTPAHPRKYCKAKDAQCPVCHKRGHFGTVCNSRSQSANEVGDDNVDYVHVPFLGEVKPTQTEFWTADLQVNGRPTTFKLDSGAGAIILGHKTLWLKNVRLKSTNKQF